MLHSLRDDMIDRHQSKSFFGLGYSNLFYHMKHPLSSYIKTCHNYILWQHVIKMCAWQKQLFPCRKNITERPWMYESYQTANLLLYLHQNMLFLVFLISKIVRCDLLWIVITLHHANLLSKRSKPRRHPSPICGKSLIHLLICSFRV